MITTIWNFITFKSYRSAKNAQRRLINYQFLKSEIVKAHLINRNNIVVDFPGQTFDATDMWSFRPPMYQVVRNQANQYCIYWDMKKMTGEVGSGPIASPTLSIVKAVQENG